MALPVIPPLPFVELFFFLVASKTGTGSFQVLFGGNGCDNYATDFSGVDTVPVAGGGTPSDQSLCMLPIIAACDRTGVFCVLGIERKDGRLRHLSLIHI